MTVSSSVFFRLYHVPSFSSSLNLKPTGPRWSSYCCGRFGYEKANSCFFFFWATGWVLKLLWWCDWLARRHARHETEYWQWYFDVTCESILVFLMMNEWAPEWVWKRSWNVQLAGDCFLFSSLRNVQLKSKNMAPHSLAAGEDCQLSMLHLTPRRWTRILAMCKTCT
jgi:hypothetical protein